MTRRERERVAAHVIPGRCTSCGHRLIVWSPERIVEAAHAFVAENGRVPKAPDWKLGTPDHPARTTVCHVFGTWNQMLAAAGLRERALFERDPVWSREAIVDVLIDFRVANGRWPRWREWAKAKGRTNRERPSSWVVRRMFGSWNGAMAFASGVTDPSLPNVAAPRPVESPLDSSAGVGVALGAATPFTNSGEADEPAAQNRRAA